MNCHGEKLARKQDTAIGALLSQPTTLYCLKESRLFTLWCAGKSRDSCGSAQNMWVTVVLGT